MEVILLEKIHRLGDIGDKVNVKPGYGRNFLMPTGKALPATAENMLKFEARRAELEKAAQELLQVAQQRGVQLAELAMVTIKANASDEGKLFGSVGVNEIVQSVMAAGVTIEKKEVHMPEGPIREVGEYEVSIQLHGDIVQAIKVTVVAGAE